MENNFLSRSAHTQLLDLSSYELVSPSLQTQWLSEQSNLPFLLQILPAHTLYSVLQKNELQESLEFIEWIRGPQLQKVLDFDIWEYNSNSGTDEISHNSAMSWVQAWLLISAEFTADRFFALEEETALLILSKFFVILPEGITQISDDVRENWAATPDKRFFINAVSTDGTEYEILTEFVRALYTINPEKAGYLFSAASMLVRQETLEYAQKWRAARIADQGFVTVEEAQKALFATAKLSTDSAQKSRYVKTNNFLAEDASEQIHDFLQTLDPEESRYLIQQALTSENIKQIAGSEYASVEHLYDDEEFIEDSIQVIIQNSQKSLFTVNYFERANSKTHLFVDNVLHHLCEQDTESFVVVKQHIARITNMVASILSVRNAYHPSLVQTASLFVRGALNIGFETSISFESYNQGNKSHSEKQLIDLSLQALEELGIDTIFKIGFNSTVETQKSLLNYLVKEKYISVNSRVSAQHWVESSNTLYATEMVLVLEGMLRTIPMIHQEIFAQTTLSSKALPTHLSQKYKPIESITEIKHLQMFIDNLKHNLK